MERTDKIACPRCGQDWVINARIKPLNAPIQICPECDAFWWPDEAVSKQSFKDWGSHMESKGLGHAWDLLDLQKDNE